MKKILISIIIFLIIITMDVDLFSRKNKMNVIDFKTFFVSMKDKKNFKISFDGELYESFFTRKKYVHYETTAYLGERDIYSTHQILYNTDKEFYLLYNDKRVKIRHSKIRTQLSPAFGKKYLQKNLQNPKNKRENILLNLMMINDSKHLLLEEYGLIKKKKYFASFSTESYYLPPGRDGEPQKRENTVLIVSDKILPNKIKLTPLYRGWNY